jgi:hypothetical protein
LRHTVNRGALLPTCAVLYFQGKSSQAVLEYPMELPCYKCGALVEEGRPFCPHCAAPQIRVLLPEPVAASPLGQVALAQHTANELPASQTVPVLALPMRWSQALRPCALAAIVASVLMSLGLNPFVAMLVVGFLAVVFFRSGRREISISFTTGAALGALSGLLWFAISAILETVIVLVTHKGDELRTELINRVQQAATQTTDPQVLAVFDRLKTPGGIEFLMLTGIFFAFLAAIVLGSLGGVVGSSLFGRPRA